ncbi:nucleotide sugar dehydrogenase [Chlorobium ferrooxidans]|uniref:UDP-glucose/GDP-mannose dehydrogenase n=1 Tax=Chlorobium ferrooxidans DSM 13031 TaxID=377431 RepID=Q0YTY6_9CHLB|nr:nucleotide sugar dehydrogenase [Chlorobium ferrooxidans]EAT59766.1 UDP-glucose/GDP-mannose dehydrogenase [Chlorobium ferrooxidans DSM 13031]
MNSIKIAVIGLGYVGLPLAVEFAGKYPVIGFDIKQDRVDELKSGHDGTLEITGDHLKSVLRSESSSEAGLLITSNPGDLSAANYYIVTVPTPTDKNNRPVLTPLVKASETIGRVLKQGDIVIYESTVYPGATEDDCVPVLERVSGLVFNRDFFAGYSPERINPGDKEHTVTKIKKVTSGSTPEAARRVDDLYRSIITAGTHCASSIKVAEAAKVIENSQRDINIAFVNELAMIFNRMGIDTQEVLAAAGTKWNFLSFRPGLVGGHCIGVDPYYLAQKAQEFGYHPEIILAGRRLNDNMGNYVASEVVKLMIGRDHKIKGARVLILGITFKENCPDIRNTKVVDIVHELKVYGIEVEIYDPWASPEEVMHEYHLESLRSLNPGCFEAVILAVAHDQFKTLDIRSLSSCDRCVVYDIKGVLPSSEIDGRL